MRHYRGMTTATGNLRHGQSDERIDALGTGGALFVAVPELAVHATAPRVQVAVSSYRGRMIGAARDLYDRLTGQSLRHARHVLPAIVAVSQASVVAAAPSVNCKTEEFENTEQM